MRDDIRELHGSDVELVEMEEVAGSYQRTGKHYAVERPDPLAGWPMWLKMMGGLLGFIVLGTLLLIGIGGVLFGLFVLWTLLWPK